MPFVAARPLDLHQGDYIQLPPAAIGVLEPLDPA